MFIAPFAGVVLTFLAGAEVDVPLLRREWRPSAAIGLVSFGAPFLVSMSAAYWLLGWSGEASAIAGIALSTTSLAVVYAVLVETGLNRERFGKLLMSATFVTDFATAAALSIIFIRPKAVVRALLGGLARPHPRPAADRAAVLPPLRQPRDRARDQARLRDPAASDVARRPLSLSAVWTSLGALGVLLAAKMIPKIAGVYPLARRTMTAPGRHGSARCS